MDEQDKKILQVKLAKDVTRLCLDYLRDVGDDKISLEVLTADNIVTTDMSGKECIGRTLTVALDSWSGDKLEDDDDD